MKHITFLLLSLSLANSSLAKTAEPTIAPIELCELESEEVGSISLEVVHVFDIKDANEISPLYLKLINLYYNEGNKIYTFPEIKKLFSKHGEEQFNDLYLYEITIKKTGEKFIEVRTWPGDNPVGVLFNVSNQVPVAYNGDGSYEIITQSGNKYCSDLIQ